MFCAIKVKKTAVLAVLLVCVLVGAAVPVLARQAEAGDTLNCWKWRA